MIWHTALFSRSLLDLLLDEVIARLIHQSLLHVGVSFKIELDSFDRTAVSAATHLTLVDSW